MLVKDLLNKIDIWAPHKLAEKWDNVGLLLGDENKQIEHIFLCLDLTKEADLLADQVGADCIITHHPLWFFSYKNLKLEGTIKPLLVAQIMKNRVLIAEHTNLDATLGGVNDALSFALGFAQGKTIIKNTEYSSSLFRDLVMASEELKLHLKKYEISLEEDLGYGRLHELPADKEYDSVSFRQLLDEKLNPSGIITNFSQAKTYRKIALFAGAYDSSWEDEVFKLGVDCIVTGEMKHHDLISLANLGIHVFVVGHDVSERVILEPLANYLSLNNEKLRITVYKGLKYPSYT